MTKPGIEIRWGKSITDPEQRKLLRSKLAGPALWAVSGVEQYGLPLTEQKYAYIHAVGASDWGFGDAPTSKTMNIYLKPGRARGRIDQGLLAANQGGAGL